METDEVEVIVPPWLATTFRQLGQYLVQMEDFIRNLQQKNLAIEDQFGGLLQEYRWVLDRQDDLYNLAMKENADLRKLLENSFNLLKPLLSTLENMWV